MIGKIADLVVDHTGFAVVLIVLLVLALMFLVTLFYGWLLMLILGAFGVNWAFWPSTGVALAGSLLLSGFSSRG